jgi:hypothetical protein
LFQKLKFWNSLTPWILRDDEGERIMPGRVLVSVSGLTKHFVYRKKFNGKPVALLKAVDRVYIDIYFTRPG